MQQSEILNKQHSTDAENSGPSKFSSDMEEFKNVMLEYVGDVLNREKINIAPGFYVQKIATNRSTNAIEKKSLDENFISTVKDFTSTHALRVDLARAMSETGRLFFFKGKLWLFDFLIIATII